MNEIWKDIPGYEGHYQASNMGRLRSLSRPKTLNDHRSFTGKILKPRLSRGYFNICLCKESIKKVFTVHRLVAITFIPNIDSKPHINHINRIRNDNRVENLEWCTPKENIIHSYNTNTSRKPRKRHTIIVQQISKDGVLIAQYKNVAEASEKTGINDSNISRCGAGKAPSAGGYKWKIIK